MATTTFRATSPTTYERIASNPQIVGNMDEIRSHVDDGSSHVTMLPANHFSADVSLDDYADGVSMMFGDSLRQHGFPSVSCNIVTNKFSSWRGSQICYSAGGSSSIATWIRNWTGTAWGNFFPIITATPLTFQGQTFKISQQDLLDYQISKMDCDEKADFCNFLENRGTRETKNLEVSDNGLDL